MTFPTQHLLPILGDEYATFVEALSQPSPISLRLNPAKPSQSPIFADANPVAWCQTGIYLPQRPSFTLDPLFHAGAYYVQEASSMFLEQLLLQTVDVTQPLSVLDMCAAPGGKTTLLASLLNADSCLLANEMVRTRAHILSENLAKWGSIHAAVTCNEPTQFEHLAGEFDVVLCDAPCSGEGMFRKNPDAINEWSLGAVQMCATRQQRILSNTANLVAPNGMLFYSTCTFNTAENEDQVAWLLQHPNFDYTSVRLSLDPSWNIFESSSTLPNGKILYAYRFYPHRVKGEGLFVACLKRHDAPNRHARRPKKLPDSVQLITKKMLPIITHQLLDPDRFVYITYRDEVFALPQQLWQRWQVWANSGLYWLQMGIKMGKLAGNTLIPAPELALSSALSTEIPSLSVNRTQAIAYLRRDELQLNEQQSTLQGWVVVMYDNFRLGWAKIIQGRLNNHYPKEWRIKMG